MMAILNKLLVKQFYQLNTGFFIFLLLLLFGLADGKATLYFHYSIMKMAVHQPVVMLALLGVWALYALKCTGFMLRHLDEPAYSILQELGALSRQKQFTLFLACQAAIFSPVLTHAVLTCSIAVAEGQVISLLIIVAFAIVVCGGSALFYKNHLQRYKESVWTKLIPTLPSRKGNRSMQFVLLHLLFAGHKKTVFLLKIFSLVLLQVMLAYNKTVWSKESMCFFILIITVAHALLPYYFVSFTESRLTLLRNMPVSRAWRYSLYLIPYAVILLPELGFMLLHAHYAISLFVIGSLYVLALSLLCLLTAVWYMPRMQLERYMLLVLSLFFISMFIMAAAPIWVYAAVIFLLSLLVFYTLYERYEYQPKPDN